MTRRKLPALFMRGGISSLSKVCVIAPSERMGAEAGGTLLRPRFARDRIAGDSCIADSDAGRQPERDRGAKDSAYLIPGIFSEPYA